MSLNPLSFLGIGTHQGQEKIGLSYSPQKALELMPLGWPLKNTQVLLHHAERKAIHHSVDLSLLDWSIYQNAYDIIVKNLQNGLTQINWGGDHSVGVATVSSFLAQYPQGHVIWIDAHADLNIPESSSTGNFHGMPLSYLLGLTQKPIKKDCPFWRVLDPKKLIYIGLRDLDPYEEYLIKQLGIKAYWGHEIYSSKFASTLDEIRAIISNKPLHISFDIDSVDPLLAVATGIQSPKGLYPEHLQLLAATLNGNHRIKSIDVVEINPMLGSEIEVFNTYAIAFDFLGALLNLNRRFKNDTNYKSTQNHIPVSNQWDLLFFP